MHPVTFEIVRLRQDELRREADRHRAVAAVRSSRTRHRLSPAAVLSAMMLEALHDLARPVDALAACRKALTADGR